MKIIFLIGVNNVGGAEYVSFQHVMMASRNAYDVTVLSGTKGMFFDFIKSSGIKIEVIGMNPKASVIESYLKDCDVVFNCNSFAITQTVISFKQKYGFRYLTIIHSNINWVYDQMLKYYQHTDGFYAIHQKIVDSFVAKGAMHARKFTVIPNCVDAKLVGKNLKRREAVREKFGFDKDDFVIGIITRIAQDKNIMDALKILKGLPGSIQAKLLIIGGAADNASSIDYERRVIRQIKELGLTGRVIITGNVVSEQVYELMQAFDIGLNCSPSEGLPIALLEMMGAEIPCIMPSLGEIPEVLDSNRGLIVWIRQRLVISEILAEPCYDEYEIQNFRYGISLLHEHKLLRENMGVNAGKYILEHRNLVIQEKMFLKFIGTSQPVSAPEVKPTTEQRKIRMAGSGYLPGETDVVYVLGTGSKWNDNELRFSLRSLVANVSGIRNIFVVGAKPAWLQNVIHIPANDGFNPAINADANIINKVLQACWDERLSDNFLFINDDHLILKPIDINQVPAFHKGDMKDYDSDFWKLNYWRGRLHRTMKTLSARGLSTFNFDCHAPILMNKTRFPEIMNSFNYGFEIGLTMKSLYGNSEYSDSGVLITKEKQTIFRNYTLQELNERLSNCQFMAFCDQGLNNSLIYWLWSKFPDQSEYESDDIQEKIIDVYSWLESSRDFTEGVELFKKYLKGNNLLDLFEDGETPRLRKKLEYKLERIFDGIK